MTPHERMFSFTWRSTVSRSIPTWHMTPGTVLLKRHVQAHKSEPLVEEVELLEANPQYAHVRLPDGCETTVSIRHLAPQGEVTPTLEKVTSTLVNPSVSTPSSPEGTEVIHQYPRLEPRPSQKLLSWMTHLLLLHRREQSLLLYAVPIGVDSLLIV